MTNMRIGRDVLSTATITATSEGTGLGATWYATNVLNPRRDRSWRSNNLTSQSLLITFGGLARTFSWIALPRHRLHGANFRPRFYPSSDGSGSVVTGGDPTGSGGISVASLLSLPSGANNGLDSSEKQNTDLNYYARTNHIPYWLPTTLTGVKSIGVDFSGTPEQFGTSLTYYELNRLMGGTHFEWSRGPSIDTLERTLRSMTVQSRAGGGSNTRLVGETYRQIPIDPSWLNDNDVAATIDLTEYGNNAKSFLLSFFPGASGRIERDYTFCGTFTGDSSVVLRRRLPTPGGRAKLMFTED
jgi:hypothetical protein